MCVQMMQPNFYCVRDSRETIERLSIYNLTIKIHNQSVWEQTSVEFSDVIFDTHRGELDETGITPALIEFQRITAFNDNNQTDVKVVCNVRKPIQIKLTPINVTNLFSIKDTVYRVLHKNSPKSMRSNDDRPIHRLNNIKDIRKLIGTPNSIEFNLAKISINFMTSLDRVVSLALFKWNNKISVSDRLKQISYATNMDTVSVNTQNSMLLHPTSLAFECMLSQEKWSKRLVIATNFTSNIIRLQINPNDFWTFAKVHLDFWTCIKRCFSTTNLVEIEPGSNVADAQYPDLADRYSYELPHVTMSNNRANEEYFQDDLR